MASVELDGINKVYDNGFHAVQDLSIDVADGEFLVLVGPSGCGKSTALRMVAGLEDISSGELRIGGKRVNELEPQDRDIAMVFQSYALYPHMSVGDNIAYGLKLRKMPKDEMNARIKKAADMLELTPLLDRKPKQLSGGQRQRVAMGRAIVREPQVFLMDEPLSNLDAKLRVQMRAEISAVVRSLKTTTLYVTHDQTEAMTMGDRMAVMKAGILNQLGTPSECYDSPNNIFVAQFVGSPPMNLVVATVVQSGEGLALQVGSDNQVAIPDASLEQRPALRVVRGQGGRRRPAQRGHGGRQPAHGRAHAEPDPGQGDPHRGARLRDHRALHLRRPGLRLRGHQAPAEGDRRGGAAHPRRRRGQVGRLVRPRARGCAWATPSRSRSTSRGPTSSIRRPPRPSVPDPNNARSVP